MAKPTTKVLRPTTEGIVFVTAKTVYKEVDFALNAES